MNEDDLARFIERSEQKHWGKYRGVVEDRNDPDQLGRLRVRVPSLLGDAITGWAWPVTPYGGAGTGFFFLPQVGDLVWVEFAEGDLDHPLWTGGAWARPGGASEIPADAKASYPDTQVLRTRSGSVIVLDDKAGSEKIVIRAKDGCEITIEPGVDRVTVKAKSVVVEADEVRVQSAGGAPQELATRAFVQQIYDQHTHPSGVGPTGPPTKLSSMAVSLTSVLEAE